MGQRVVITGLGIFTGNGHGKEEFWASLRSGKVGYNTVTLFDASELKVNQAAEVSDFDPKKYMGMKGLRTLDRSVKLLVSASKLAVADSGFEITDENADQLGVSVGTTLGSIKSIAEFDLTTLNEGPRYTNPALFPNTVINSPASQVSIWNNIKGFNTTISSGFTASLDAMQYAYDFIQLDRAKIVFSGSIEEMNYYTFYAFHTLEFMSGSREGESFVNCPFDKRRNGITFGEAAGLVAMEDYDHAKARAANIMAEVLGFGTCFDPFKIHKYNPRGTGLKKAMCLALEDANLDPKDIDCIFANANSTVAADKIETEAIKEVFGNYAKNIPVTAVKSMTGECYSASGMVQAAAALGALTNDFIPPTVNCRERDPDCDLDYVPNKARNAKLKNVLIICFSPNGGNTCMVLGKVR